MSRSADGTWTATRRLTMCEEFQKGDVVVRIGTPGRYVVENKMGSGWCFMSMKQMEHEFRIGYYVGQFESRNYVKTGTTWDFKKQKEVFDE